MAKIYELSESRQNQVEEVITELGLDVYGFNFKFYGFTKMPAILVKKGSPEDEYNTDQNDLIKVYVNEAIFDAMENETTTAEEREEVAKKERIIIENELSRIEIDTEKDKIKVRPLTITTSDGMIKRYTSAIVTSALSLPYLIAEQLEEKRREEEAAKKEAKKAKKNQG